MGTWVCLFAMPSQGPHSLIQCWEEVEGWCIQQRFIFNLIPQKIPISEFIFLKKFLPVLLLAYPKKPWVFLHQQIQLWLYRKYQKYPLIPYKQCIVFILLLLWADAKYNTQKNACVFFPLLKKFSATFIEPKKFLLATILYPKTPSDFPLPKQLHMTADFQAHCYLW